MTHWVSWITTWEVIVLWSVRLNTSSWTCEEKWRILKVNTTASYSNNTFLWKAMACPKWDSFPKEWSKQIMWNTLFCPCRKKFKERRQNVNRWVTVLRFLQSKCWLLFSNLRKCLMCFGSKWFILFWHSRILVIYSPPLDSCAVLVKERTWK